MHATYGCWPLFTCSLVEAPLSKHWLGCVCALRYFVAPNTSLLHPVTVLSLEQVTYDRRGDQLGGRFWGYQKHQAKWLSLPFHSSSL